MNLDQLHSAKHPRKWLAIDADLSSLSNLKTLYAELENEKITDLDSLEEWILRWSELDSAVMEQGSRCYVAMTCDTKDPLAEKNWARFVSEVDPLLQKVWNRLEKKLDEQPERDGLKSRGYELWLKKVRNSLELFREENIPIETEIALEVQNYQKVTGAMSILWKGEEIPLSKASALFEENDREVRKWAWNTVAKRRLQDRDVLNGHFDKLLEKRLEVSKNCGFNNFIHYIFLAKERFDYDAKDCRNFHQAVEKHVVPLYRESLEKRRKIMGLEKLRPWDLDCDPRGLPPLRPARTPKELEEKVQLLFSRVSEELAKQFEKMRTLGLIDSESRLGKAPGGYQCALEELRLPFIFMNSSGTHSDLTTLLHEGGHSFHQFAMEKHELLAYRDLPAEFAEVASMSMELLAMEHLEEIYTPAEAKRGRQNQLEDTLRILPWVARIDAFQHWIYENPKHSHAERDIYWLELDERFGPPLDWSGLEDFRTSAWQRQLHLFEVPFYYIEYGIAQLGALQLWKSYRQNRSSAVRAYRKALSLGGSRPLPELFQSAGLSFDFSAGTMAPLMEQVAAELDK